jgi:mono/diheme cytochrome c family protein
VTVKSCLTALALSALSSSAFAYSVPQPGPPPPPGSPPQAVVEHGDRAFQYYCGPCHAAGQGDTGRGRKYLPGTDALNVKYKGERPALLEERTDLTPEFVKLMVRQGVEAMPSFRKTELSDANLDAIAAYLARNNK